MSRPRQTLPDGTSQVTSVYLNADVAQAIRRVREKFGKRWVASSAISVALLEACERALSKDGLLNDERTLVEAWGGWLRDADGAFTRLETAIFDITVGKAEKAYVPENTTKEISQ